MKTSLTAAALCRSAGMADGAAGGVAHGFDVPGGAAGAVFSGLVLVPVMGLSRSMVLLGAGWIGLALTPGLAAGTGMDRSPDTLPRTSSEHRFAVASRTPWVRSENRFRTIAGPYPVRRLMFRSRIFDKRPQEPRWEGFDLRSRLSSRNPEPIFPL